MLNVNIEMTHCLYLNVIAIELFPLECYSGIADAFMEWWTRWVA